MPSRPSDVICAVAGLALFVVVFLPWWEFDAGRVRQRQEPMPGILGYLDLYAPAQASPWDALRGGALIWLTTAVLAVALAVVGRRGAGPTELRRLRTAVAVAALLSLIIAAVRLSDPPLDAFVATPLAYVGMALIAVIVVSAVSGLRPT